MTRSGMVFSIDAGCRLGVEEVEGAASYWHGVRRLHLSAPGKAGCICARSEMAARGG
jgi:hypothetical protein